MHPPILITDAEQRSVLAACRSLDRAGYGVSAVASTPFATAHWSRACDERLRAADPLIDEDAFIADLEGILARRRYALLLPGTDASLFAISRHRDRLERWARLALPARDVVERSLDKLWLTEHAPGAGLAAPRTVLCAGEREALAAADSVGYPLFVKPRAVARHVDGRVTRLPGVLVRTRDELQRLLPAYGDEILIQAPETGRVYSYGGVIADGRVVASALSRYHRTYYPDAGNPSFSETVRAPSDLTRRVESLLHELGWEGIFDVELIERGDGTFAAIDLNPRPYGSMELAIQAGADLPAVWCDHVLAGSPRPRGGHALAAAGVRYRWEEAELKHFATQVARRRFGLAAAVCIPHREVVHAHFRTRDPGPLAARALAVVHASLANLRGTPARARSAKT